MVITLTALFRSPATAQTTISDAKIPTLPPPPSTQRHLLPSPASFQKTLKTTASLFPSRNPPPSAAIQRSGDMGGAQAKKRRGRPRSTLLPAWSGRTLEARRPPPRHLVEKLPHPYTPIDQAFRVSRPPGLTAPGRPPDPGFMGMTLLRRSSVPPSNARSMMWSL